MHLKLHGVCRNIPIAHVNVTHFLKIEIYKCRMLSFIESHFKNEDNDYKMS